MNELIRKHSDLSNSIIKRAKVTFTHLKTVNRILNWLLWHCVFWDIWHIWQTLWWYSNENLVMSFFKQIFYNRSFWPNQKFVNVKSRVSTIFSIMNFSRSRSNVTTLQAQNIQTWPPYNWNWFHEKNYSLIKIKLLGIFREITFAI